MKLLKLYPEDNVIYTSLANLADQADTKFEKNRLKRLRVRAEINWRRYVPLHR